MNMHAPKISNLGFFFALAFSWTWFFRISAEPFDVSDVMSPISYRQ